MSACRRLVLLISIIGGFIRIWLFIPNQFVIASYLAVAEHQIMFSLHSVSCKKPPTSECIQFFFIIHGDICKLYYWIWTLCMASRRTSCILFEFTHIYIYIYIYIHGNKRLIVSDADSLTFVAQSPEACVFVAFEIYSAIGSCFINNLQHSCESRVHPQ